MSHFTNFSLQLPKQRHKGFLPRYFYCNKCPPIDSRINQRTEKKILLGKKKIKWYFEKVIFNPRIKADLLKMFEWSGGALAALETIFNIHNIYGKNI